jgi:hypothetical protein
MRSGIILSIFASLVLVGGAAWSRLSPSNSQGNLVAAERNQAAEEELRDIFLNFSEEEGGTPTPADEPTTSTELVGQQLMFDYLSLANKGQVSEANLVALADRYVESIPTLSPVVIVGYSEIKTVPDNLSNFQTYANGLGSIYAKYAERVKRIDTGDLGGDFLTPNHYAFAEAVGQAYQDRAIELKNLTVPVKLASFHLRLVNANLAISASLKTISEAETDPAKSLAGVVMMNQKIDEGIAILREIHQEIVESNDI